MCKKIALIHQTWRNHGVSMRTAWCPDCVHMVLYHYSDAIMGTTASQITSLTIVYSTVYSDADQRKHQSSASLDFVLGIHRGPVNSPHKRPVTRKMFPFDDVIMTKWIPGGHCWKCLPGVASFWNILLFKSLLLYGFHIILLKQIFKWILEIWIPGWIVYAVVPPIKTYG